MDPKISIITITFNSENTVRDTFESIRRQHYRNLEYIVIDGGSTDSTLSIANEYRDIISNIVSEPDNGISDAMNKGIKLCTGELIGIIHSDDMLTDGALNALAAEFHEGIDIYYGNAIMCTSDGIELHTLLPENKLSKFKYQFCLIHPSTFITLKSYNKFGLYDENLRCSMDYDLLLRFYNKGACFKYINYSFTKIRMGGTNQKYRKSTINEVCEISIKQGGNPMIANIIKKEKIVKDYLRPFAAKFHIINKRIIREK